MICAKCGVSNPDASAYCGSCGSQMAPKPGFFLASHNEDASNGSTSSPGQEQTPTPSPIEEAPTRYVSPEPAAMSTPSPIEETPTRYISPEPSAMSTPSPIEEVPTRYVSPEPAAAPAPQTPQPVPAPDETLRFNTPMPQGFPGMNPPPATPSSPNNPAYPARGTAPLPPQSGSGNLAYPAQGPAPLPPQSGSGNLAYPAQGPAPMPQQSGAYPAQGPAPMPPQSWSGGTPYPAPGMAPQGWQGNMYPSTPGSGTEFPSGVYPTPGAMYPGGTESPTFPLPGQGSGFYPGQPSQSGWVGFPGQVPPPASAKPSALIKPLPIWAFILSILVVAVLLVVLVFFTGADWAAGAQTAGIVALILGALILIAFGVRSAVGMLASTNPHRLTQIISALLLAVILFALGAVGLTQQSGIHAAQARSLEGQQKWQTAIDEYQAGGQGVPFSEDIARVYNEWGEQLVKLQQYNNALDKFNTVIANYDHASMGLARAKSDAASTYYSLAEQELAGQKYADAAMNFNQLTTNFPDSSKAKEAHGDYAKALWGQAQPELTTACSSALTIYQQLSSQFSDTPDGTQAVAALKQPVQVKGHFTSTIPGGTNSPAVGLVQGVSSSTSSNDFYAILAKSPVTTVHSDGTFVFPSINQGSYYLVWGDANSATGREAFLVGQRYPAMVGQLCPFDFGDISENFPTP